MLLRTRKKKTAESLEFKEGEKKRKEKEDKKSLKKKIISS